MLTYFQNKLFSVVIASSFSQLILNFPLYIYRCGIPKPLGLLEFNTRKLSLEKSMPTLGPTYYSIFIFVLSNSSIRVCCTHCVRFNFHLFLLIIYLLVCILHITYFSFSCDIFHSVHYLIFFRFKKDDFYSDEFCMFFNKHMRHFIHDCYLTSLILIC